MSSLLLSGILIGAWLHSIMATLLVITSIFLILLILVQRGRGGGLSGALGGMGGQSAFGTKAGDTFTYITIGTASVWILLSILALRLLTVSSGPLGRATDIDFSVPSASGRTAPAGEGATPSTTPSTSTTTPGTSTAPGTSTSPGTSTAPGAATTPGTSTAPNASTAPDTPSTAVPAEVETVPEGGGTE